MVHPRRVAFTVFILAAFICFPIRAQESSEKSDNKVLSILFTSGFRGRFSEVDCKHEPGADLAQLIGAIEAARKDITAHGQMAPVVLNGGNNISPHAFSRYVLSRGAEGGALLAGLMKRVGYDAIAFGNLDFYAHESRVRTFLLGAMKIDLPLLASNLSCKNPQAGFCGLLEKATKRIALIERDGVRIAVLSLLPGDLASLVASSKLAGIEIKDPLITGPSILRELRLQGADVIVVLSYTERAENSPRETLALAQTLAEADLVITDSFQREQVSRSVEDIRFHDGASTILGCGQYPDLLCRADLTLVKQNGRFRVQRVTHSSLRTAGYPPEPDSRALLLGEVKAYCREWDRPLGRSFLEKPMAAPEFSQYLIEIMRNTTQSDLAFINYHLVNPSVFPLTGSLSSHDLFVGLSYRNELFTFDLTGEEILALCGVIRDEIEKTGRSLLLSRGLDCGGNPTVNGRPIDEQSRYKAITITYLAQGMLGYFTQYTSRMSPYLLPGTSTAPSLGEVAESFFQSSPFTGPLPAPISLAGNFPDLGAKLRWTAEGGSIFNFADTAISNASSYPESQLNRQEFLGLNGEVRGRIAASSRFHWFSFDLRSKYARHSVDSSQWEESEDLTVGDAIYTLNLFPGSRRRWYVPNPAVEVKLETEWTRPRDDLSTTEVDESRDYHHLEITNTLGGRMSLWPNLDVKLGLGARKELLDARASWVLGLDLGYTLLRTDLFQSLGSLFQLESSASVFFGDMGKTNTMKGDWMNRLYFSLIGSIYFAITHELFVYRASTAKYALASDLTFGLSYRVQTARQTF